MGVDEYYTHVVPWYIGVCYEHTTRAYCIHGCSGVQHWCLLDKYYTFFGQFKGVGGHFAILYTNATRDANKGAGVPRAGDNILFCFPTFSKDG